MAAFQDIETKALHEITAEDYEQIFSALNLHLNTGSTADVWMPLKDKLMRARALRAKSVALSQGGQKVVFYFGGDPISGEAFGQPDQTIGELFQKSSLIKEFYKLGVDAPILDSVTFKTLKAGEESEIKAADPLKKHIGGASKVLVVDVTTNRGTMNRSIADNVEFRDRRVGELSLNVHAVVQQEVKTVMRAELANIAGEFAKIFKALENKYAS